MQWQSCQMQSAAFLICLALFKGPFYDTNLCHASESGTDTELGLATLKFNVLEVEARCNSVALFWQSSCEHKQVYPH